MIYFSYDGFRLLAYGISGCNLRGLAVADAVANGRGADAQRSAGGSLTPTIG